MKRLLFFLIFQGSLDGFTQIIPSGRLPMSPIKAIFKHDSGLPCDCDSCFMSLNTRVCEYYASKLREYDTVASVIHYTGENQYFCHAIKAYCLYFEGACTGDHIKQKGKKWVEILDGAVIWKCSKRPFSWKGMHPKWHCATPFVSMIKSDTIKQKQQERREYRRPIRREGEL